MGNIDWFLLILILIVVIVVIPLILFFMIKLRSKSIDMQTNNKIDINYIKHHSYKVFENKDDLLNYIEKVQFQSLEDYSELCIIYSKEHRKWVAYFK